MKLAELCIVGRTGSVRFKWRAHLLIMLNLPVLLAEIRIIILAVIEINLKRKVTLFHYAFSTLK
jgi:hypothetical protein